MALLPVSSESVNWKISSFVTILSLAFERVWLFNAAYNFKASSACRFFFTFSIIRAISVSCAVNSGSAASRSTSIFSGCFLNGLIEEESS